MEAANLLDCKLQVGHHLRLPCRLPFVTLLPTVDVTAGLRMLSNISSFSTLPSRPRHLLHLDIPLVLLGKVIAKRYRAKSLAVKALADSQLLQQSPEDETLKQLLWIASGSVQTKHR